MPAASVVQRVGDRAGLLAPGVLLCLGGAVVARAASSLQGSVGALVIAVALGVLLGNTGVVRARCGPGLRFCAKRVLRVAIVLLGLRLSLTQVGELGAAALAVVVVTVIATFFGTRWAGGRLGLSRDFSLLVGTGFSICGASAIAAVEGATDATEEEVAAAIGLVTLAGSVAIVTLPLLGTALGMDDESFGAWTGASVHDVAQVAATASTHGTVALSTALVVKLTRVILLAPIVGLVNLTRARSSGRPGDPASRPVLVPLFVAGFLAAVALRTTGVVPAPVVDAAEVAETFAFSMAMVALGTQVQVRRFRALGPRALALGAVAWAFVGVVSLVGVTIAYS